MINLKPFPPFVLICVFLTSCQERLDGPEYIRWVHDYKNGLHVKKTVSEFIFDLQYQPAAYVALINNDTSRANGKGIDYYTLKVSLTDPEADILGYNTRNSAEREKNIYYFSYLFQNDLYLEEGEARMPCVLYHFVSSGFKKDRTFVLGFENSANTKLTGEPKFVIDSRHFGSLPIKIKVSRDNIPALKI